MVKINNSDLFNELRDAGKIQQLEGSMPNQLADKLIPVIEVNPKLLRRVNRVVSAFSTTSAATTTLLTVPSNKDFFITSCSLALHKDVACDAANGRLSINITHNGIADALISIPAITLTAQSNNITTNFSCPIRVDRGTNITLAFPTYTVGVALKVGNIQGYFVDNINA